MDVDYDVGMETAGRYGTRGNRQMATRAGASRAQVRPAAFCLWTQRLGGCSLAPPLLAEPIRNPNKRRQHTGHHMSP